MASEEGLPEKRLVAYLACDGEKAPEAGELCRHVKERLPDYMVPSAFVILDQLPLTPNGKVDHRRLPEPDPLRPHLGPSSEGPRDPLEAQLIQIWEELLGVEPIGIHDNFFELGGHSLLAVELMARIEEACGRSLPLSILFKAATIEELATALLRHRSEESGPAVLQLQGGHGGRRPFFYLHGDFNGGGFYSVNLARHLGTDQPFYVLEPHGLHGERVPATIEAMAEEHLKRVRQVQPHGPYQLGGHCNGGLIAYEMARRLREAGEEVALLVVIDAALQNNRYKLLRWAVRAAGQVANLTPEAELEWFLRMKRAVRVCVEKRGKQRSLDLAKRVKNLMKKVGRRLVSIEGVKGRPGGAAGATRGRMKERHHSELNGKYVRALEGYVAQRYAGKVTLFWPAGAGGNDEGRSGEWRKVAREVEVHRVPGEHLTCLTKHIGALAGHLRTCLNDTQNG